MQVCTLIFFNIWYYLAILLKSIILAISLVNSFCTIFNLSTNDEIMGAQKIRGEIKVNISFHRILLSESATVSM